MIEETRAFGTAGRSGGAMITSDLTSGAIVTAAQFWDGKDWQNYCMNLLRAHYGPHGVQLVPDRHQGDLGIEAFAPADGCVFQCYAAQEPLSTKALYESQRDKLTLDLGKLKEYKDELHRMFGTMLVRNYVLMVPRYDSNQLIRHATTKAVEVATWNLPFVDAELRVTIVTDDAYVAERKVVYPAPAPLLRYDVADDEAVSDWRGDNDSLVVRARGKLEAVGIGQPEVSRYLGALLVQFLNGENASEMLRETFPDQWASVKRCRSSKERLLALQYPPAQGGSEQAQVAQIAQDLANQLQQDAPALDEATAQTIAWSAVADWLMRCPLDWGAA